MSKSKVVKRFKSVGATILLGKQVNTAPATPSLTLADILLTNFVILEYHEGRRAACAHLMILRGIQIAFHYIFKG